MDAKLLRDRARANLAGNWGVAIAVAAVACLLGGLMEGHKFDLFWLHLTFLGWDLLAALTMNIGYLVLNPYRNAAEAAFYRTLTGAANITEYL